MTISRQASVFLLTLGMSVVMVALAFGLVSSMRIQRESLRIQNLRTLAEHAALSGARHAFARIESDYLSHPGVPTTLNDRYRSDFATIDSLKTGKNTASINSYRPYGATFSPEDLNANDTPTDNLLTQLYQNTNDSMRVYFGRTFPFALGSLLHQGLGRYIEVGSYDRDLTAHPISFHLRHPVTADPSSTDPAVRTGEPWIPDLDEPLYLDSDLGPVDDRDQARYRLRYAVAIEALNGHLLLSPQGTYDPTAISALNGTPTDDDADRSSEIDPAVAQRYVPSFVSMLNFQGGYGFWGWTAFLGRGAYPEGLHYLGSPLDHPMLVSFQGTAPYMAVDDDGDFRIDESTFAGAKTLQYTLRGPFYSPTAPNQGIGVRQAPTHDVAHTWTPYLTSPHVAITPTKVTDSYTDCPWMINLPTAPVRTVSSMLTGYLPQEFKTVLYDRIVTSDYQRNPNNGGSGWVNPVTQTLNPPEAGSMPTCNLFDTAAGAPFADVFGFLGGEGYPGAQTNSTWRTNLGKDIDLNTMHEDVSDLNPPRFPMQGVTASYHLRFPSMVVVLEQPFPGGVQIVKRMNSNMEQLQKSNGYWYADSYWMDLATAFGHTMAVSQLSWLTDDGRSWTGNPDLGRPRVPINILDAEFTAGAQFMDLDMDGDGTRDTPSMFASVAAIDRQFVKNMGEYPQAMATRPTIPHPGLYLRKSGGATSVASPVSRAPSNNIASLLASTDPGVQITPDEAGLMELVLNDMRMSFFGSSPQYPDWRGIDFDGDGSVRCSAYRDGSCPADVASGWGRIPDPAQGDHRFSLTGCFAFQKSRQWRIFVRGEVFDEYRQMPVIEANYECAYAFDSDGELYGLDNLPLGNARDPNGDGDPRDAILENRGALLYQRWIRNRYDGFASHAQ